jgi:hypothetical protein
MLHFLPASRHGDRLVRIGIQRYQLDIEVAKLADLKKRGVIIEAEFESQKTKILASLDQPRPSSDQVMLYPLP